jgi:hypothetical protein
MPQRKERSTDAMSSTVPYKLSTEFIERRKGMNDGMKTTVDASRSDGRLRPVEINTTPTNRLPSHLATGVPAPQLPLSLSPPKH